MGGKGKYTRTLTKDQSAEPRVRETTILSHRAGKSTDLRALVASVPSALPARAESHLNPEASSQNKQEQLGSVALLGGWTKASDPTARDSIPTVHSVLWIEAEEKRTPGLEQRSGALDLCSENDL